MPELPEVEIARRQAERWFAGLALVEVEVGDASVVQTPPPLTAVSLLPWDLLRGARLDAARRRAKLLYLELGPACLLVHFRMTGKLVRGADERARLCLRLSDGSAVSLVDRRRLAWVALVSRADAEAFVAAQSYGPEPFPAALSVAVLGERLRPYRTKRLKDALMDQSVIAGLGNIAVSEVMWRARLGPDSAPAELTDEALERLSEAMADHVALVLSGDDGDAMAYVNEAGAPNPFLVYGREGAPCPRCAEPIVRRKQAGRSTFSCPHCQSD